MRTPRPLAVIAALVVSLVAVAACTGADSGVTAGAETTATTTGSPDTTAPSPPPARSYEPATDGTLVLWAMDAGECHECGFRIRLDASGTATLDGDLAFATADHDVAGLRSILTTLDPDELITGQDDCGREVDGNAPRIELYETDGGRVVIDDCYTTIDRSHPLMELVTETERRLRDRAVAPIAEVLIHGGRCVEGECRSSARFAGDGRWFLVDGSDADTGALASEDGAELVRLVSEADEEALVLGPFEGVCPTAFDGQARTYRVVTPNDLLAVDTCRHDVAVDAPLIRLLDRLVGQIRA